jgi:hypothetical protein
MLEKYMGGVSSTSSFMEGEKERHLRNMRDYDPNNIIFIEICRQNTKTLHGNL